MNNTLYKTLAFGALAGMRSLAAPTLLSHFVSEDGSSPLQHTPLRFLGNSTVAMVLKGLAASELVGDKMPGVPDRIELPSLIMRGTTGAVAGAAIYLMSHKKAAEGAAIGAVAAIAATYGSFYLRKTLCEKTRLADPIYGALEDALVIASGIKAAQL
ncbi:DUF4126 family protein [Pontibacter diazotrophicus]|uniref:DUF4126 family protein n=1 Tax=Pontibacter diazotrophicus TaxID=1400979 RepID=A0A3D8LIM6_9BACT|nr:DUF4126 family protein [Pontibacter diazotrophicus]RDV16732.1 DUF4126 family protein [Pontibacter diazotrophicus]